ARRAGVVLVGGVVQLLGLLVVWLRTGTRGSDRAPRPRWQMLRLLAGAAVLLVCASYWFVREPPQAHAFYVLAPIVFLFAAYWWTLLDSPRARRVAAVVLAVSVLFHAGPAWAQAPGLSLYRDRGDVAGAVRLTQSEMF